MRGGGREKTCLFSEDLVTRELSEVQELQVQGPKLRQDAAASGHGPAPASVRATEKTEAATVTLLLLAGSSGESDVTTSWRGVYSVRH